MRLIDLTGQRFGKILVLSKTNNTKETRWLCQCDCGTIKEFNSFNLRHNLSKSCGCKERPRGKLSSNFHGIGDLPKKYYSIIKNKAKLRKIKFDVSIEYLWELFQNQNGKCALSNIDITFATSEAERRENIFIKTASLDRIDSSKGYVEGNVQWVHKDVNFMKQAYDEEYFIEMCCKIANFHSRR